MKIKLKENSYSLGKIMIALLISFHAYQLFAQVGGGNGGDVIRNYFIDQGTEILNQIRASSEASRLQHDYQVDVNSLYQYLNTKTITVVTLLERDNTGSEVDGIAVPRKIKLKESTWREYITAGTNLSEVIFHEILRAAGANDDDFKITRTFHLLPKTESPPFVTGYANNLWWKIDSCAKKAASIVSQDLASFLLESGCLISNPTIHYNNDQSVYLIKYQMVGCKKLGPSDFVRAYYDFPALDCTEGGSTIIEKMDASDKWVKQKTYEH